MTQAHADLVTVVTEAVRKQLTAEITPYVAQVTAVTGAMITFQATDSTVQIGTAAPRLAGFDLAVNDYVLVIGRKSPVILERIWTTLPSALSITGDLTVDGDLAVTGTVPGSGFVTPPSTGWTTTTLGSATFAADGASRLLTVPAVSGDNWRIEYRTPAATSNYTFTAYLDQAFLNTASCFSGICLRSSGGAYIAFGPAAASGMKLGLMKWNSATSYSADYIRWDVANTLGSLPNWYRFRDDGTTRFAEVSFNGLDWITVHSVGRTDFLTMSQIGWGMNFNNTSVTNTLRLRSWEEA